MGFKKVELKHVIQAVKDLLKKKANHGQAEKYAQEEWCGTDCCVLGHAWFIASNKIAINKDGSFNKVSLKKAQNDVSVQADDDRFDPDLSILFNDPDSKLSDFKKLLKIKTSKN